MRYIFFLLGLITVSVVFTPHRVQAQILPSENTVTLSPAFQEIEIAETASQAAKTITVTNTSNQPITLEVLPSTVDQQNLSGRISFELFSGVASDSFPFLSFSVDRFVLEPQASQEITVTIENRSSLRPGGTYVAVIFRNSLDTQPTQQVIVPAVASLLLINKTGGATYNLSLKEVIGLPSNFSFSLPSTLGLVFANEGNTHIQPHGTISFTGLFSRLIAQSTINESSLFILPLRQRMIQQEVHPAQPPLPIDFVWVEVTGTSGSERTPFTYETGFLYISRWLMGIIGVIILTILIRIIMLKRTKK